MSKRSPVEVIVYFADPKELWAQKVEKVAVIFRQVVPGWLGRLQLRVARSLARGNSGNTGNCCWLIRDAQTGDIIEEEPAPTARVEYIR